MAIAAENLSMMQETKQNTKLQQHVISIRQISSTIAYSLDRYPNVGMHEKDRSKLLGVINEWCVQAEMENHDELHFCIRELKMLLALVKSLDDNGNVTEHRPEPPLGIVRRAQ